MESERIHPVVADPPPDLPGLVEHRESVAASATTEQVYETFQKGEREFLGVLDTGRFAGVVSRSHLGFLLGSRYGFAVHGRQPIGNHLVAEPLQVILGTPVLEVCERALGRQGERFYDDVALVSHAGEFLGMIPVQALVRFQSLVIQEQVRLGERHQAELREMNRQLFRSLNELRQSRGRFDILFENSALGVALLNANGEVETCNRRFIRLVGETASLGEGSTLNLTDLIAPACRAEFLALLQRHEDLGGSPAAPAAEFTLNLVGCGPRLFRFFTNWIQETGQICALLDDITEQRVLERRMAQKEKSALLELLVGGIAHELNNKLVPVSGFSELLIELCRTQQTQALPRYCAIIRDSSMEAAKIIRQLLHLSRPHKLEPKPCDLRDIVKDALDFLEFRLRQQDCRCRCDLAAEPATILADPSQIKQVVINLVLNAIDAMNDRPLRQLTIRLAPAGSQAQLQITDTGHGIKPDILARIFDPFFTTKGPDHGSGLGLSVCYSILKQHGGDIVVESRPDQGATFSVTLPLTSQLLPDRDRARTAAAAPRLPAQGFSTKVLIVDDEDFVTSMIQEVLRVKLGCRVDRAADGAQAVQRLLAADYDLIVSDVRMPGMDGFELLDWLRQHKPPLVSRFLFVTGDAGSSDLNQRLDTSDMPVLRKPFGVDLLVGTCQRLIKTEMPRFDPELVNR